MDYIKTYNEAINQALEAIGKRIDNLDIDQESNKIAGLETAYAMLRGLLK